MNHEQDHHPLQCDLLIVGAGPVGSTLACLLGDLSLRIVLVDRLDPQTVLDPHHDGRTTAISWGSSEILDQAGVWPSLLPHGSPIEEIRVSQSMGSGFIHFDQNDAKGHPMGFIVRNNQIRRCFYDRLALLSSVRLMAPRTLTHLKTHSDFVEATLNTGEKIQSRLIIGADGRSSSVREACGLQTVKTSYNQTALVTTVHHEKPHHRIAFEHFLPTGPLAFLPIDTHHSSVVWSLKNNKISPYETCPPDELARALESHFPYLGRLTLTTERWFYPLGVTFARRMWTQRCALAGDAAHGIHPVAGQGANLGFRDALVLADLIREYACLGLDVGSALMLQTYQRRRLYDRVSMTGLTDGLVRLFSQPFQSLALIRGYGLSLTQSLPFLRKRFAQHAMGIGL